MKWNFIYISIFLLSAISQTHALDLSQRVEETESGFQVINTVKCPSKSKALCRNLCHADRCEWAEPLCRDCFGTGDSVMRDVFQNLTGSYRVEESIPVSLAIQSTLHNGSILVSTQSLYDFYNASNDAGLGAELEKICGSRSGFVSVLLDTEGRPEQAHFAICSTAKGSRVRRLRPLTKPDRFESETTGLQLQFSRELQLGPMN